MEGETLVVQRQLTRRFGLWPTEVIAWIFRAAVQEIDIWVYRVLEASSLEEVFSSLIPNNTG